MTRGPSAPAAPATLILTLLVGLSLGLGLAPLLAGAPLLASAAEPSGLGRTDRGHPAVKLYINNRAISLELKLEGGSLPHPHTGSGEQGQGERWLIPLEAAKYLGVRAEVLPFPLPLPLPPSGPGEGEGPTLLRWGSGEWARLLPSELTLIGKEPFIPLERLIQLVGGKLLELEGAIYTFVPQAKLHSVSYDRAGEVLLLKLSRLAPVEVEFDRAGRSLALRLYNTVLKVAPGVSRFTGGRLRGFELWPVEPSQVLLELELPPGVGYRLTEEVSEGLVLLRVHLEPELELDNRWAALAFGRASSSSAGPRSWVELQLTPWLSYHREVRPVGAGKVRVDYLLVRRYREHYRLRAALPEGELGHSASVAEMVQQGGGIAGINANFFDPGTGLPIGLVIKDGQVLSAPYGRRAVLGIDLFGGVSIFSSKITLYLVAETEEGEGKLGLSGLNEPLGPEGLYLFTSHYSLPIRVPSAGLRLEIELRGETVRRIVPVKPGDHLPRPSSGSALLVALGGAAQGLHLERGERVTLSWRVEPPLFLPLRDAISAGPLLLKGGGLVLDHDHEGFSEGFAKGRATRSAVGLTREGDLIMLIAQGIGGFPGLTLEELALLMRELGAVEALALDGGSSASLVFRRGLHLEELGSGREVPVGLILIPRS